MELYIKISFWAGIIGVAVRAFLLSFSDYPRTVKWSRGEDVLALLAAMGFAIWGWMLVYA